MSRYINVDTFIDPLDATKEFTKPDPKAQEAVTVLIGIAIKGTFYTSTVCFFVYILSFIF